MANKIALITGGSRGLGKDMALRLAQNGHTVVITFVSQKDAAEDVVKQIEALCSEASALQLDLNNIASLSDFVNKFRQTLQARWNAQAFDFLVNNAGIGANIPFLEATEADFDQFQNSLPIVN